MTPLCIRLHTDGQKISDVLRQHFFEAEESSASFASGGLGSNLIDQSIVDRTSCHQLERHQCEGEEIGVDILCTALQSLRGTVAKGVGWRDILVVLSKGQNLYLRKRMPNDLDLPIFFDEDSPWGEAAMRVHTLGLSALRRLRENLTARVEEFESRANPTRFAQVVQHSDDLTDRPGLSGRVDECPKLRIGAHQLDQSGDKRIFQKPRATSTAGPIAGWVR